MQNTKFEVPTSQQAKHLQDRDDLQPDVDDEGNPMELVDHPDMTEKQLEEAAFAMDRALHDPKTAIVYAAVGFTAGEDVSGQWFGQVGYNNKTFGIAFFPDIGYFQGPAHLESSELEFFPFPNPEVQYKYVKFYSSSKVQGGVTIRSTTSVAKPASSRHSTATGLTERGLANALQNNELLFDQPPSTHIDFSDPRTLEGYLTSQAEVDQVIAQFKAHIGQLRDLPQGISMPPSIKCYDQLKDSLLSLVNRDQWADDQLAWKAWGCLMWKMKSWAYLSHPDRQNWDDQQKQTYWNKMIAQYEASFQSTNQFDRASAAASKSITVRSSNSQGRRGFGGRSFGGRGFGSRGRGGSGSLRNAGVLPFRGTPDVCWRCGSKSHVLKGCPQPPKNE